MKRIHPKIYALLLDVATDDGDVVNRREPVHLLGERTHSRTYANTYAESRAIWLGRKITIISRVLLI